MNLTWHELFLIAAFVCALLATLNVPGFARWAWFPASLLFLIIAFIFT